MIEIVDVGPTGERFTSFTIEGEEQFALFPSFFSDKRGGLYLAWEEMVGGNFDIYFTPLEEEKVDVKWLTYSYSHNRLVRGLSIGEGLVFAGRTHTKEGDTIWYMTSSFPKGIGLCSIFSLCFFFS